MKQLDRTLCMAKRDGAPIFSADRCQEPATHESMISGRFCARHAEALRQAYRDPHTLGNTLAGDRARTEEEIAVLIRERL